MKDLAIPSMWAGIIAIDIVQVLKIGGIGALVVSAILVFVGALATMAILNPSDHIGRRMTPKT